MVFPRNVKYFDDYQIETRIFQPKAIQRRNVNVIFVAKAFFVHKQKKYFAILANCHCRLKVCSHKSDNEERKSQKLKDPLYYKSLERFLHYFFQRHQQRTRTTTELREGRNNAAFSRSKMALITHYEILRHLKRIYNPVLSPHCLKL